MQSRAMKRIQRDLLDIEKCREDLKNNGVYVYYDENNIKDVYTMFIGTENTPYHHGYYFVKFTFPDDYPMSPPKAFYSTQGRIHTHVINNSNNIAVSNDMYQVRFNPNLYTCGKVCLSMLNTWNGPGWVPTNTLTNVFMALQALVLNEYPLHNEPGYTELPKTDISVVNYNRIIQFANCKIAILEMMENPPKGFEIFKKDMEEYFLKNYENILKNIDIYKQNKTFAQCSYCGNFKLHFEYDALTQLFQNKYNSLLPNQKVTETSTENVVTETSTENVKETVFNITNLSKEELMTLSDYGITKSDIQNDEELASAIAIAKLLEEDEKNI